MGLFSVILRHLIRPSTRKNTLAVAVWLAAAVAFLSTSELNINRNFKYDFPLFFSAMNHMQISFSFQTYRASAHRFLLPLSTCLHTTAPSRATPYPVTATGPPPSAPIPAASQYGEQISRRRRQAELLKKGQDLRINHVKPGTALKKRFWKDVHVKTEAGAFVVLHTLEGSG